MHYHRHRPIIISLVALLIHVIIEHKATTGLGYNQYNSLLTKKYNVVNAKRKNGVDLCVSPTKNYRPSIAVVKPCVEAKAQLWYADNRGRLRNMKSKRNCLVGYEGNAATAADNNYEVKNSTTGINFSIGDVLLVARCAKYSVTSGQVLLTLDGNLAMFTSIPGVTRYISLISNQLKLKDRVSDKLDQKWRLVEVRS